MRSLIKTIASSWLFFQHVRNPWIRLDDSPIVQWCRERDYEIRDKKIMLHCCRGALTMPVPVTDEEILAGFGYMDLVVNLQTMLGARGLRFASRFVRFGETVEMIAYLIFLPIVILAPPIAVAFSSSDSNMLEPLVAIYLLVLFVCSFLILALCGRMLFMVKWGVHIDPMSLLILIVPGYVLPVLLDKPLAVRLGSTLAVSFLDFVLIHLALVLAIACVSAVLILVGAHVLRRTMADVRANG